MKCELQNMFSEGSLMESLEAVMNIISSCHQVSAAVDVCIVVHIPVNSELQKRFRLDISLSADIFSSEHTVRKQWVSKQLKRLLCQTCLRVHSHTSGSVRLCLSCSHTCRVTLKRSEHFLHGVMWKWRKESIFREICTIAFPLETWEHFRQNAAESF